MGTGIYKNIAYGLQCLMDLLFPREAVCGACGRVLKDWSSLCICPACLSQIKLNEKPLMTKEEFRNTNDDTQFSSEGFDACLSVCVYEGIARSMIHNLKYKDKRNAAATMAALMMECMIKNNVRADLIIPVPIHRKRLRKRGYNQAELISSELSNLMNLPYLSLVERIKDTPSQVLFNGIGRWYNVKDAFICRGDIRGKAVVLVDDVITTGATAYFCACALRAAGAGNIIAVSFAKAD